MRMNQHRSKPNFLLVLALAAGALALASCSWPSFPSDDAGDESFVRQIVPILYGRKIRGYDEVKLLSHLVSATDRRTVVRALMERPEYVEHWSEVLVDDLEVQ